jgi:YrbI family 3-deoxy-D-manno-octulosonate 8-phosphate phosphatase
MGAAVTHARTVLAVVPARGGSRGVPGKNLAVVGGQPLVARAVRAALGARYVDDVVVSTDDSAIAGAARAAGAEVVLRPAELSGDLATSESALLHAVDVMAAHDGRDADVVVLVQCTSPFVTSSDIDGVVAAVVDGGADAALTVAEFHGFVWRTAGQGVNHDPAHRPRRQDRPRDLLETGAAYAMTVAGLRSHNHRFFGRVATVEVDPARTLEIDDPHDLARARALAPLLDGSVAPRPSLEDVDAVVLDFDGTQTDDRVTVDEEGRECVTVHRGDGLGVAALRRAGVPVLILSTETNRVVAARARKLRVPVRQGVNAKDMALKEWCDQSGLSLDRTLYVGNDVNDLPCFDLVGWPVAVADAHDAVRARARAITTARGGNGAVREIASWLLGQELNGRHTSSLHR